MGPLLNLTREGNRTPSLRSSLSLSLSAGCLLDLVQTQVDMCSQNFQEILLGNLNLKFPVEAQLEMVRRS
jgi:hypothetical protein